MALKHINLPYNLQSVKIDLTAEQEKTARFFTDMSNTICMNLQVFMSLRHTITIT